MTQPARDMRILWGSPLPPTHSGVADYAVELLPALARHARLRVLRPPEWQPPGDWPGELSVVPSDTERQLGEHELLHLGNNPYHLWLLPRLRRQGALVVLHDVVLHHLLVEWSASPGSPVPLADELGRAHGEAGRALAEARTAGLHGRLDPFLFPARKAFLRDAAGVIVHSEWAVGVLAGDCPGLAVRRVPLAAADPGPVDRRRVRQRLGLSTDEVVLMHLGFLTREKGMEAILAGFAAAVSTGVDARLVVVGEGEGAAALLEAARSIGVEQRIVTTGYVAPETFLRLPAAADLGVVFRNPSAGETSAAALRFLACGVPVAVGARRQFLEWPETVAPRISPGASAAADMARWLCAAGSAEWAERRSAARMFYEASHTPDRAARAMLEAVSDLR